MSRSDDVRSAQRAVPAPADPGLAHVPDPRLLLEAERDETARRLAALTDDFAQFVAASRDTNADDEHDPEGATIAFERSQVDALVRQSRRALEEVDAALERLAAGNYGICETCGRPIVAPASRGPSDGADVRRLHCRLSLS